MLYNSDILLELTFSVKSNMSENQLLKQTVSFYVKKLNCQAALILQHKDIKKNSDTNTLFPKAFKEDERLEKSLKEVKAHLKKRKKEDLKPLYIVSNGLYIYAFKLSSYGYFVSIKMNEFPRIFVNNLIPVFQFYGDTLYNKHQQEYQQKIERLLLKERKLFKTILNNIPVSINLKDLERKRVLTNRAELTSLKKGTEKEVIGLKDDAFYDKETYNTIKEEDDYVIANQVAIYNKEIKKGTNKYFLVSKIPYLGNTNKVEGIISLSLDITNNKQKEKDLLFFKEIINQSSDATILTFEDGHFYYCNSVAKNWLGINENNITLLKYQELDEYFLGHDQKKWNKHLEELQNIKTKTTHSRFIHSSTKKTIPVEIKQECLINNGVRLIVTIARNITQKQEVEMLIKEEIRFQNLLLKISSTYINTQLIDIENTIQQSLREIGLFVKADRSYIFDYDEKLETSSNTFEWCEKGISPEIHNLQKIPAHNMEDWIEQHQKGLPFLIENVEDLPYLGDYCLKEILSAQDIKSLITIPMLNHNQLVGFVGFDSVKKYKTYTEKEKKLLSLYAGLLVNIKNRKKDAHEIRHQGERFKSIIQSVDVGLIEVNANFEIVFANENLTKIYEYEINEILGKNAIDLFLKEDVREDLYDQLNYLKYTETLNLELSTKTKTGKDKYIFISIGVKTNEKKEAVGFSGALLDVTQQKKLESDLKLAKEKAESASREKDRFLANMSHEMRTPLNIINGVVSELYHLNKDSEEQSYLLKQTKETANYLLNLVNNVLDMAKINAGEMVLNNATFDLKKVCQDGFSILETIAKEKKITYSFNYDPNINSLFVGDALKISQVLVNLLHNAIKYTSIGSVILDIILLDENSKFCTIQFRIKDTGDGMSKEFIKVMYTEFATETNTQESTGLGMPIAKKILDLMGGEIEIESEKGKGTTIHFVVNIRKQEQKNKGLNEAILINNKILIGKKILVVEDNHMNALIVKRQLERNKLIVTHKIDGVEAIKFLEQNNVDLILMDIQMPHMDGIECTKYIRNKLKLNVPIIAFTANVFKNDLENYLKLGINDYLTKPFKESVLIEKCYNNLTNKSVNKEDIHALDMPYKLTNIEILADYDEDFAKELEQTFKLVISNAYEDLNKCIEDKDLASTKRLLHKIKPSIQDLELIDFISYIKEIMKATEFSAIEKTLEILYFSMKKLRDQLNGN